MIHEQFAHPGWFWLVVLVPLPWLLEVRRPRIAWPSFEGFPRKRRPGWPWLRWLPSLLRGLAIAAIATALARPQTVGVLCVEFFLTAGGRLLVNEIAPRPHNSGHLTIEAAAASQFDQQVRALCGLPLAAAGLVMPAAMVNLLGDVWTLAGGHPRWDAALAADPGVALHLYGKRTAAPGRKMGHLTVLDPDPETALLRALAARRALAGGNT